MLHIAISWHHQFPFLFIQALSNLLEGICCLLLNGIGLLYDFSLSWFESLVVQVQFVYFGVKLKSKLFNLSHNQWIGFPECGHIMTLMLTMDNTLRAYGRTGAIETEVVYLFFGVLSALIPFRSELGCLPASSIRPPISIKHMRLSLEWHCFSAHRYWLLIGIILMWLFSTPTTFLTPRVLILKIVYWVETE